MWYTYGEIEPWHWIWNHVKYFFSSVAMPFSRNFFPSNQYVDDFHVIVGRLAKTLCQCWWVNHHENYIFKQYYSNISSIYFCFGGKFSEKAKSARIGAGIGQKIGQGANQKESSKSQS